MYCDRRVRMSVCLSIRERIGVNAAGVAGVATPPPIFDLQGSSCVDDPQYFDKCFIFFHFSGTSEYLTSLSFSSAQSTVFIYEVCGDMDLPVCIVRQAQTGTSLIQLQSTGHMNLKNNTPRMHHITPF